MFGNVNLENTINLSLGASLLFYNIGLNRVLLNGTKLENCSKTNITLGSTMGAFTGCLYIYKALKH